MKRFLTIESVTRRYGAFAVLDNASAVISTDDHVGIIGRNGAGKTTLFRIITGEEEADDGKIGRSSDLKLGYLTQHDPYTMDETVIGFLTRETKLPPWECAQTAGKFHLHNDMLETRIGGLSGGYRMRIKLAAMLLQKPHMLLLDEPTNYLDLSTLIILERVLASFNGGTLIISHDREFLKRTTTKTLEVENGGLTLYPGGVEEYIEFKDEMREQAVAYNKGVEEKRKQLQDFIDRFHAKASKAAQARSKMKQIERLSTIQIAHQLKSVRIPIPPVEAKRGIAFETESLSIGYPERTVASNIRFTIERGRHVALLGNNGEGKTTMLRTIAGDLAAKDGAVRRGDNISLGYFAQHVYASIAPGDTVLSYLERMASQAPGKITTTQTILDLAGGFLFKGDAVKKSVSVLSGGERSRLCLAGLLLMKHDALLLDEPTNHLDIETVEALGDALRSYAGTIIFVSHDRTFVNLAATDIIEIGGGRVLMYPGTYEEYVWHLEQQEDEEEAAVTRESAQRSRPKENSVDEKRAARAEIRKLREQIQNAERDMERYDAERKELLKYFESNPADYSPEKHARLSELEKLIKESEAVWLTAQESLVVCEQKR
ncbi:MAG: ABC-F family ATP-binding cassette domain-containing protein [Spirochaetes bacterium]|nr:ABC-F family ATP-binding cassette domain-containing protein [Spirochaetota bacterium]